MKRKIGTLTGSWERGVKDEKWQEKTENHHLVLILLVVFIISNPFFLPFLVAWMFWWLK